MKQAQPTTYWNEASFLARFMEWIFPSLRGRRVARSRAAVRRIAASEDKRNYL